MNINRYSTRTTLYQNSHYCNFSLRQMFLFWTSTLIHFRHYTSSGFLKHTFTKTVNAPSNVFLVKSFLLFYKSKIWFDIKVFENFIFKFSLFDYIFPISYKTYGLNLFQIICLLQILNEKSKYCTFNFFIKKSKNNIFKV